MAGVSSILLIFFQDMLETFDLSDLTASNTKLFPSMNKTLRNIVVFSNSLDEQDTTRIQRTSSFNSIVPL